MKLSITSLELKNPFKFFALSYNAMQILKQLKGTGYKDYKSTGFWTKHYTMTLWENQEDINAFYKSGAHLDAMKKSREIAKEIRTIVIDANSIPSWKEAKEHLKNAKVFRY